MSLELGVAIKEEFEMIILLSVIGARATWFWEMFLTEEDIEVAEEMLNELEFTLLELMSELFELDFDIELDEITEGIDLVVDTVDLTKFASALLLFGGKITAAIPSFFRS